MKPNSSASRASWMLAAGAALLAALPCHSAFAQGASPVASGFAKLEGYVTDSVHNAPLTNAIILVEGTDRTGKVDESGHYVVDSIPPGSHHLQILHPILDTLSMGPMRTPAIPFAAGETHDLDLAIPSAERLVNAICNSAQRMRGPGAMIGFVRDPETKGPAVGSKVQLVYYVQDVIGRKTPRVSEATVDSTGTYKICGLTKDMSGKVQVYRNGVSSGEVPAAITNGFLALRGFTVSSSQTVVEVKGDSGKIKRVAKGTASVTGRVLGPQGQPLSGARVSLQGGVEVTLTKANGEFSLDSLPSGTQALDVRKLPYAVTEVPVELASNAPARAIIKMTDTIQVLAQVRVEAQIDKGLSKVGYLERKNMGMGYFFDGRQINHDAHLFSDVMRISPGLTMQPTGDGRTNVIKDSRNQQNGCVNFYVDNSPYQEMVPGDIDDFIQPSEVVAVEVYHGTETPPQFTTAGQSSCATVVIWTQARVGTQRGKTTPP